jgi:exodeoxyribonuclease VII small subunit
LFGCIWHIASQEQWYPNAATVRVCGCDASHGLTRCCRNTISDVTLRTLGGACNVHSMARNPTEDPKLDFETAMRDLEELVERLEQGDLPLEESLAAFERGVMLTRSCQTALKEAEQKVEILLKKAGEPAVEAFHADEDGAS